MKKLFFLLYSIYTLIITNYLNSYSNFYYRSNPQAGYNCCNRPICEYKPATIFIHGTLYPFLNIIVHVFDMPLGLTPATVQGNKFLHGRIGYILNAADPVQFPLETFYLFGWTGRFSFQARKRAAYELYYSLKNLKGPITIIAHSHGGNVVLELASIVKEYRDSNFKIDKLILLACPVLALTEDNIRSPIFKKVISLYSTGDGTQISDPQKFFRVTRRYERQTGKIIPFFSKRTFASSYNLIQRRILYDRRNLRHLDFIYKPFLTRFPAVINLIENSVKSGYSNNLNKEFIINIPRDFCLMPELLVKYPDNSTRV